MGTLAGGGLLAPAAARAARLNARGAELATLYDLSKCVGCGACVEACRESNAAKFPEPEKPFPSMFPARVKVSDFSDRRDVDDRLTPYNWLYIQSCSVEYEGKTYEINMPRRCMHCQNPPCANLCPWGAAGRQENGIVRINEEICLGGAKCKAVCPWKIPQRQTGVGLYLDLLPAYLGNGVMYKCDRCYQLVAQGEVPACVSACPYEVQTIGPRDEIVTRAHELAESMRGYLYGETENGGTNTLYVSPVPFEAIEAALQAGGGIDQAQGRPNLKRYGDPFAREGTLAKAALLAPVAGVVGGLLSLGRRTLGCSSVKDSSRVWASPAWGEVGASDASSKAGQEREVGHDADRGSHPSRLWSRIFVLLVTVLTVSGLAQMPIFKRYYVADLPGLGWLAEFWVTHQLHYMAAAGLLVWLGAVLIRWFGVWRGRFQVTALGWVRIVLLAGIVGSGVLRIYKNQPGVAYSPDCTLAVDWMHLGLAALLGATALAAVLTRHSAYLRPGAKR